MCRFLWLALACVLVSSPAIAFDQGIPATKLQALKAATVYVKVEGKQGAATGSGFLIRVEGQIGYIVTNRHVIAAVRGKFTPRSYSLVFGSGRKTERVLPAEVVASDAEHDLAVLKVTASNLPTPLDLTQTVPLRETMTIYTLGFPLGELLSSNQGNPAVTIGTGTISSLREDASGKLQRIQLDGEVNPGNSGGPVIDGEGRLVGIVVSKIVGTKISFAIPAARLREMLQGHAAAVILRRMNVGNGSAEIEMEIPLIDPLHQIRAVELRHVRKEAVREALRADKDGHWPDLPGASKVPVRIVNGKAIAKAILRGSQKKRSDWLFQAAYTNSLGKAVATQPVAQAINFAAEGAVRLDSPGNRPWETIVWREGGFTVDMPVKPKLQTSRSARVGGSTMRMFLLGCDTDTGVYLAFRIDIPQLEAAPRTSPPIRRGRLPAPRGRAPMPKTLEAQILEAQRDYFVQEWHGKVEHEKKVLAQGHPGLDFTVIGKPDDGEVSTIRVREYLVGRSIFMVAVFSRLGGELPEDAGRFLGSMALGQERIRATGTVEPEPTGTELPGWGWAIDTDKDCKFTPGPRSMTIDIPAKMHDLGGALHKFNAPRVMREVNGDFVLTVKIASDFKPSAKSTNPRSVPYLSSGILLWSDSANFIRLERGSMRRGNQIASTAAFEEWEGGYRGAVHNQRFKEGDCYLRLERKGSQIHGAISSDGRTWQRLRPIDTVWPSKLKVGLHAVSTSTNPFTAKFEEFELSTKGSPGKGGFILEP